MDSPFLEAQWRIVVLVTADTLAALPATLDSVQRQSLGSDVSLLASPTASVRNALDAHDLPVHFALPESISPAERWASVAASLPAGAGPVVLLHSGCHVPQHWDARLVAAGQRNPLAAIIAPLSARHPFTSLFTRVDHEPALDVDALDQWLNDYSDGRPFPLPLLPAGCLLLQGEYWQDSSVAATDSELLEALTGSCLEVLADTQLYVDDTALDAAELPGDLPRATLDAYSARSPLAALRHAITELSVRGEAPPAPRDCKPVQLHVGHSWGGGLGRWMHDFVAADRHHNHLVLRSIGDLTGFGQSIVLYRSTDMEMPIRSWTLTDPVLSVRPHCPDYRALLEDIVAEYNVESLVVSSVIGHTLDLLDTHLPTTVVLHDFFPFCPALYATFDSPCIDCSPERLGECGRDNPQHSFFRFEDDAHWLRVRALFLDRLHGEHIALVAPSMSVVERYRRLAPALADLDIVIVPHGLDPELIARLAPGTAGPEQEGPLRIVVLGRTTPPKGSDLLDEMLEELTAFAEVHLLGTGQKGARFEGRNGVLVTQEYAPEELGDLLRDISPHMALLLSVVPETFSYTLSELQAARVPVMATRVGAFVERIEDGGTGWLVPPEAAAVLDKVRALAHDRPALERVRNALAEVPLADTGRMSDAYAGLVQSDTGIPLARYYLPRRSYANPYGVTASVRDEALIVGRQVPYKRVLEAFLRYSAGKVEVSEKVPQWLRPALAGPLRFLANRLSP